MALSVLLFAGCSAAKSATPAASGGTKSPGESSAVQQLGAEFYVTAQSYIQHTNSGDMPRAAADREKLLGNCDTARLVVPAGSQGKNATYLRTLCQTLGAAVP